MFCPKCGNEIADDAAFCGKCGAQIQNGNANAAAADGAGGKAAGRAAGVNSAAGVGSAGPSPKKSGGKIGITVAAVVVVLIIIVGFATNGFGLFGGIQPKEAEDVQTVVDDQTDSNPPNANDGREAATDSVKSFVEDYTWDELSEISAEIAKASDENEAIEVAKKYNLCTQDGKLDGTQTKSVALTNGVLTSAQIIGFAHDEKASGGKAGITFLFSDAISMHCMREKASNTNGQYADTNPDDMSEYLKSDALSLLPDDLKSNLVSVNKKINAQGGYIDPTRKLQDGVTWAEFAERCMRSDSVLLWLPATVELCGDITWYTGEREPYNLILDAEGKQYKLFRDCAIDQYSPNDILKKTYDAEPCIWWERTPTPTGVNCYNGITGEGNPDIHYQLDEQHGVVPGFCI